MTKMRWTENLATRSIWELHRAGVPVNYRALTRDNSHRTLRILKKITGQKISTQALYGSSIYMFGSWDSSLKKAGIDPAKVRRDRKYWTKPLVIEAIRALHKSGVSLSPTRVQLDPASRSSAILYKALNHHTNAKGVYLAAIRRFPSWEAALREARVPYGSLWSRYRFWNRSLVLECLQELHLKGFVLNSTFIKRDTSGEVLKLVERVVGSRSSGSRLVVAARTHFGSWNEALKVAELDPPGKPRHAKRFWTKDLILIAIKAIVAKGHIDFIGTPYRTCPPEIKALLLDLTGFPTDIYGLVQGAKKLFGSWNEAVKQAGLEREKYRINRVCNEIILQALQELHKNGEPLNAHAMHSKKSKSASELVYKVSKHWKHTQGLYRVARHRFHSWDEALKKAGLNPYQIRTKAFRWKKSRIERGLMFLHMTGVALHASSIRQDNSTLTRDLLLKSTRRDITGKRFFGLATRFYGSWDKALEAASINPCSIRKAGSPLERKIEKIIQAVLTLKKENVPLNYSSLIKSSRPIRYVSHRNLLGVVSGLSILKAAVRKHGSWDKALISARLNPDEIRLRSRCAWTLSIIPHQVERVKDASGTRLMTYMGEPPKAPDAVLEQVSLAAGLEDALGELEENDRSMADQIFSMILSIDPHREDIADWPGLIERHTEGAITADEVQRVLRLLRSNLTLKSYADFESN